ncbi:hypothetical protein [Ornithinibacillus sp. JPR2-1]|uniref:hypothetical protein n=1 Tax=Ornithinibacillus sp. JPR2-1 TaxID=2094019 RepID=UPI0031CF49E4
MKKYLLILIFFVLLAACNTETATEPEEFEGNTEEKRSEMLDKGVEYYLNTMTNKYSSAFTLSTTNEEKAKYLNEAITDINLAVQDIEDNYEEGTPPTQELFDLADSLLKSIESELTGDSESAYDSSYDAGVLIRQLSDEYLGGELPFGIQLLMDK